MVHDSSLSPEAQMYIQSLTSPDARDHAREYAHMDEQVFRARIGPGLDTIQQTIIAVGDEVKLQGRTRRSRDAVTAVVGGVGTALLVAAGVLGKILGWV